MGKCTESPYGQPTSQTLAKIPETALPNTTNRGCESICENIYWLLYWVCFAWKHERRKPKCLCWCGRYWPPSPAHSSQPPAAVRARSNEGSPAPPASPSPTRLRGCLCETQFLHGAVLTMMPALYRIQMTPRILQYSLYSKDFFRFFFCRLCMYHL